MQQNKEPIFLIDATGLLVTCFHASQRYILNSKNKDIAALVISLSKVRKLINTYMDKHIALVFDHPDGYFRHDLFPEYKGKRKAPNPQLTAQKPAIKDMFTYLGFPVFCAPKFEADDVIGTIAKHFSALGHQVIIESKDKDFVQLIDENISITENTSKGTKKYDITNGHTRFKVPIQYSIDYQALVGDTVDNIPGVPSMKDGRAIEFINKYGSLNEMLAYFESLEDKTSSEYRWKRHFETYRDRALLCYELAKIRTDVEFEKPLALEQLEMRDVNTEALLNLFEEWELFDQLDEICESKHPYLKNQEQVAQELKQLINSRPAIERPALTYKKKSRNDTASLELESQ